ncbi:glutaredoxin domain-containing protein [Ditylenchus destructor]|uniref:Glutaredoxin domain-containing protein n=1 Tax=Ditylenchus destructor TaxID=166010 RepID=A0AAD4N5B5_9BILA|nr:glutaredoxin domain-containing protein [Ditylenchus destructor]
MGTGSSKNVNEELIKKEVKEHPIVMYTKSGCGYCTMAKDLLNKESLPFHEKNLVKIKANSPSEEAYQNYVNGLVYITRQSTVPQIFVCERFIGGYTELSQLHEANKLWAAVRECSSF